MTDLSYKELISKFFVDNELVNTRNERVERAFQFVVDTVPNRDLSEKLKEVIKSKVSSVEITFFKKWRQCGSYSKEEFENYYDKWIKRVLKLTPSIMTANLKRGSTQKKKKFEELSERQKNRRAEDLGTFEIGQLLLAAAKSAKDSNQSDLHYVLNDRRKASDMRRLITAHVDNEAAI